MDLLEAIKEINAELDFEKSTLFVAQFGKDWTTNGYKEFILTRFDWARKYDKPVLIMVKEGNILPGTDMTRDLKVVDTIYYNETPSESKRIADLITHYCKELTK
jgi:hypothetical protein